jgi:hypothetical protein
MSEQTRDTSEDVRLMQVQQREDRPAATHSPDREPSQFKRRAIQLGVWAGAALLVGGAVKVGYSAHEKREHDMAGKRADEVTAIRTAEGDGTHLQKIKGMVVLLGGSRMRSTPQEYNPQHGLNLGLVHPHIQSGNIDRTVGEGEAVILSDPIIVNNGVQWVEAIPEPPINGEFSKGTAQSLADETVYSNLTDLLEQKAAMVCNQTGYGTANISKDFAYVGADGQPTATYANLSWQAFNVLQHSGVLNCTTELDPVK